MWPIDMPEVLCPNCVQQGHLKVFPFGGIPILSCRGCKWWVNGWWEGTDVVFPDPHVICETGQPS